MTETRAPGETPPATPAPDRSRPAKAGAGREERLAAALRANLARRKTQGRARAAADAPDDPRADDTQEE